MAHPGTPTLVTLLRLKLDAWLLMTAGAPSGFVRAASPKVIELGVVREDKPGMFRVIVARADVSADEMAGIDNTGDDLHFDHLFVHLLDEIEGSWTL